jgi:hypothetical protein
MKNEISIPLTKEEDLVAANMRRDNYSLTRDQQAQEYNHAITCRLKAEEMNQVKCEKCGKILTTESKKQGSLSCQECS